MYVLIFLKTIINKYMPPNGKLTLSIAISREERNLYNRRLARLAKDAKCTSISHLVRKLARLREDDRATLSQYLRKLFEVSESNMDTDN